MHSPLPLLLLLLLHSLLPLALTSPLTLTYTPLSPPSSPPHPLAILTLSPPLLTSYTPPPASLSASLLRLSLSPQTTRQTTTTTTTSSTLTLASSLHRPGSHLLVLLSPLDNTTISASFHPGPAAPAPNRNPGGTDPTAWPALRIAYAAAPPQPVLNRPIALSRDGVPATEGEAPEKTFLQ
ncbi:hypothetical protein MMC15_006278, partial [Xylographa vitiligo]|nr:hypothetical protein [Xylographa vitiligo]